MSEEIAPPEIPSTKSVLVEQKPESKAHMLYIDNMRVTLIALVIVGHMAITYGAPLGVWYYREEGEVGEAFAIIATFLLGIGASFLLGLFYMIAGYFTPRPYDRKGPKKFILERLTRLGIPLILYAVVINPLVTYWAAIHGGYKGSILKYIPSHLSELQNASVGPLWFVEALLAFSILYALGRLFSRAIPNAPSDHSANSVPRNRSIVLFAMGLGLLTFLVRILAPFGWWWEPLHQEPGHFPQYVSLFFVGIIAYRQNWFTLISTTQARVWGWIALALVPLFPALAIAAGALRNEFDPAIAGGFTWLSLAYSLWEAFIGVALVITVLVWFRNRFNRQSKFLQAMSSATYAVYVLHPMIIVPLALALSRFKLNLELKFVLIAPLAVAISFLVGYFICRLPVIRRIL